MFSQVPPMSYDQMIEERARTLEQWPRAEEQLPAYSEATKDKTPVKVAEKELARKQPKTPKASDSKISTLKSILTGDVQKHNPRYVLEESMTGKPSAAQEPKKSSAKSGSSSTSSTLMSILTGDVYKHHPMYRLEESVDPRMRRER
ncbi:hypothetical protein LTR85_002457 [Meristemomyces frigidus]|nr:hypothetical protein LTR85_002457 [Meristemomyces frigidus]